MTVRKRIPDLDHPKHHSPTHKKKGKHNIFKLLIMIFPTFNIYYITIFLKYL